MEDVKKTLIEEIENLKKKYDEVVEKHHDTTYALLNTQSKYKALSVFVSDLLLEQDNLKENNQYLQGIIEYQRGRIKELETHRKED